MGQEGSRIPFPPGTGMDLRLPNCSQRHRLMRVGFPPEGELQLFLFEQDCSYLFPTPEEVGSNLAGYLSLAISSIHFDVFSYNRTEPEC
jgi:hypothetical protein